MKPDESTPPESRLPIVFGVICLALALLPWAPFDWYLKRTGREYITTATRELLQANGSWGYILSGFVGAILGIGRFHFGYQRSVT
jgi:hypothetical protein